MIGKNKEAEADVTMTDEIPVELQAAANTDRIADANADAFVLIESMSYSDPCDPNGVYGIEVRHAAADPPHLNIEDLDDIITCPLVPNAAELEGIISVLSEPSEVLAVVKAEETEESLAELQRAQRARTISIE